MKHKHTLEILLIKKRAVYYHQWHKYTWNNKYNSRWSKLKINNTSRDLDEEENKNKSSAFSFYFFVDGNVKNFIQWNPIYIN